MGHITHIELIRFTWLATSYVSLFLSTAKLLCLGASIKLVDIHVHRIGLGYFHISKQQRILQILQDSATVDAMALMSNLCKAKVYDLDVVLVHDKVTWFDVIMLYAFCVNPHKILHEALSKGHP
jgi:hypothetical protein